MNKKKFLIVGAILALGGAAAFNMNINSQKSGLSDIALANVEALAKREDYYTDGKCYSAIETHATDKVYYCSFSCSVLLSKSAPQNGSLCGK